jgi:hypothetical protein
VTFHYLGTASPTAISLNSQSEIRFYPNPAADFLFIDNIDGESLSAEVYDLQGRKLLSFEILSGDKPQINISDLEKGLYVLRVVGKVEKVCVFGKE